MNNSITEKQAREIGDCYAKARNEVNLSLLENIYSSNIIVHDPSRPEVIFGLAALKAQYECTHAAVPDLRFSLDDMFVKGDKIVWIFTMSGTITGAFRTPLGELAPTGNPLRLVGTAVDRIVEGKIAEEWLFFNMLDILQPLGFTLSRPMPPHNASKCDEMH